MAPSRPCRSQSPRLLLVKLPHLRPPDSNIGCRLSDHYLPLLHFQNEHIEFCRSPDIWVVPRLSLVVRRGLHLVLSRLIMGHNTSSRFPRPAQRTSHILPLLRQRPGAMRWHSSPLPEPLNSAFPHFQTGLIPKC